MKLLLFDVDLTLVDTGGSGREAMTTCFQGMFGVNTGLDDVSFAGRTDPAIFRDALKNYNLEWDEVLQNKFKKGYLDHLVSEMEKPDGRRHIEPGVRDLLDKLATHPGVTLALLTGNWHAGAKIKLELFDLWRYFEFGAFADDAWVRSELPAIAARKFMEIKGSEIAPQNVYVIGDTPRDVECSRPFGAKSVAVATGFFSYDELKAARPDYLFKDLSDIDAFLRIIEE